MSDIDLFEINETFATVLVDMKELGAGGRSMSTAGRRPGARVRRHGRKSPDHTQAQRRA